VYHRKFSRHSYNLNQKLTECYFSFSTFILKQVPLFSWEEHTVPVIRPYIKFFLIFNKVTSWQL